MEPKQEKKTTRRLPRRPHQADIYTLLAKIFIAVLVVTAVLNIVIKDKEFSDSENRVLASFPKFTWESVKSGKYMSEFENYAADQFVLRNQWISLKLWEDLLLGKRESNGVYLGKKGYLMEVPDEPDQEQMGKNMENMAAFAERHSDVPVYVCLAPNSFYILKDKLPFGAPVRDQAEDLAGIKAALGDRIHFIDVTDALKEHSHEYIYYKTDHHWTSLGASYAFAKLAKDMDLGEVRDYTVYTVANDFQGTLASQSGDHRSRDTIQIYDAGDGAADYLVLYPEEGKKSTSIYDSSRLKEKDKYTVFFGGNHARVDISTTESGNRNLLLFKDSYANCMVQFLLPCFQNIIMVDPRYFYDNVDSIMENQGITDVLFLYNVNTFVSDNSIADVLEMNTPA